MSVATTKRNDAAKANAQRRADNLAMPCQLILFALNEPTCAKVATKLIYTANLHKLAGRFELPMIERALREEDHYGWFGRNNVVSMYDRFG